MRTTIDLGFRVTKDQPYTDEKGRTWVTPTRVAEIWNERAQADGIPARYTRFSVLQRVRNDEIREKRGRAKKLTDVTMNTPLGTLYLESWARSTPLRARDVTRPDLAESRRKRTAREQKKEG